MQLVEGGGDLLECRPHTPESSTGVKVWTDGISVEFQDSGPSASSVVLRLGVILALILGLVLWTVGRVRTYSVVTA